MTYKLEFMSLAETQAFATLVAEVSQPGDVITLQGDLGAGKSEFARAFIRSLLGLDTQVPSPTFTLVQLYDETDLPVWHFDLYRLEKAEEVWELGLEEALEGGICLIEWPERLPRISLKNHLHIHIHYEGGLTRRLVEVTLDASWAYRFESFEEE